jgi:exocyst complex component 8
VIFLTSSDILVGLVQWVKEQIEAFANMFRRQVYGSLVDEKDVEDSLQAMRTQSKRVGTCHSTIKDNN